MPHVSRDFCEMLFYILGNIVGKVTQEVSQLRELGNCFVLHLSNTTQSVFAFGPWSTSTFQFWPFKGKSICAPLIQTIQLYYARFLVIMLIQRHNRPG